MNPQKDVLKVVVLIVTVLVAGYFILDKNNVGNTGRVIDTSSEVATDTVATSPCSPAVNIAHEDRATDCSITITKDDCTTADYAGSWDTITNSCSPHN